QLAEGSTRENISRQFQVAPKITSSRPDRPASRQLSSVEARRNVVASGAPASGGRFCPSECRGMTFNVAEQAGLQR
ncbi:MAG: hypothetical protein WA366_26365, partial [Pseudolabrys sp.]